ncbi:hypothetical protein ACH5RR_035760 [Cinchona calisaya]|uniref:glutathione transferase n=1 Tax=Cinchona calisaya TaxID=153742 RepID=A0ABD2Y3K7_9GENT
MAAKDVKLLGTRPSSYVNKVQFALNLKSIEYEFLVEKLPEKSELLLKSNPVHKKIPVLIHGDKPVCESSVIVEYIDEAWSDAPSILPSHPYERANARFWAAYITDKWFPLLRDFRTAKDEESKAGVLEKIFEGLTLLEGVFVKSSNGKAFFGGEAIGYLDIVLGSFLCWVKAAEIMAQVKLLDETKTPALVDWAERFISHEAIKGVMLEPEELVIVAKTKHAAAAAAAAAAASK